MIKGPMNAEPSNGSAQLSHSNRRSIFRSEALSHYRQSQDRIEFPRFATPRALSLLWIIAVMFIILGTVVGIQFLLPVG